MVAREVISDTHRPEDLIPAFYRELEELAPVLARVRREGTYKEEIEEALQGTLVTDGPENMEWAQDCVQMLMDDLNDNAPEGTYFGAGPGDGASFGFWPVVYEG